MTAPAANDFPDPGNVRCAVKARSYYHQFRDWEHTPQWVREIAYLMLAARPAQVDYWNVSSIGAVATHYDGIILIECETKVSRWF